MKKSIFYRKPILFSLVLAAALCWPLNALAQGTGMYFSVFGGGTYLEDSTLEVVGSDVMELEFDTGWNVGGAIGHDYGNFRAELELAYRENELDTVTIFPNPFIGPPGVYVWDGTVSTLTYMVNVFYDFENNSSLTPYIGAGIGGATINYEDNILDIDEDDTVFAYKGVAGVALNLAPNLDLLVDYSYLATTDPDFDGVDAEYATHSVSGGIRFRF